MSNYNNLKSAIQSVIKANGNNEITGPILQAELLSMITTLGAGYQYMGVAQPSTNPGTPDARVMYLAYLPGTYVNFGGLTVTGFCVLKYDTSWSKEDIPISGGGGADFLTEPDDLTLETVGNTQVLKFANRSYNNNTPNGLGYKILRGDLTFAEQVTDENTIYEIRYNFTISANFTMPANCVLDFRGGSINGAYTFNLNNCQIIGTNEWIGETLIVAGKTTSPCFADWFKGTDVVKITRAIEIFSVVNLNARDYEITSPIVVNKSFALIGQAFPDFYGNYHSTPTDYSASRLVAANDDSIITFAGQNGYYGSVLLDRVSFLGNERSADGFKTTCYGAPARPVVIRDCTFKSLNRAIAFIGGQSTSRTTAVSTININGCNISWNNYAIYAEGISAVICANITGNNIEQNVLGGICLDGPATNNLRVVNASISIIDNMMEGQPNPISIRSAVSLIRIIGNYLENGTVRTITIIGNGQTRVEIKGTFASGQPENIQYYLMNCVLYAKENLFNLANKQRQFYGQFVIGEGDMALTAESGELNVYIPRNSERGIQREYVAPIYSSSHVLNTLVNGKWLNKPVYNGANSESWAGCNLTAGTYTIAYVFYRKGALDIVEGKIRTSYVMMKFGTVEKSFLIRYTRINDFIVMNGRFTLDSDFSGTAYIRFYQKDFSDGEFYISKISVYSGIFAEIISPVLEEKKSGTFNAKPSTLTADDAGYTYFDNTNGKMIVWNGTGWVNMDGTPLT